MILYGGLANGTRKAEGQKLCYKDVAKRHLKAMNIDVENWEELAEERSSWWNSLHNGKEEIERKIGEATTEDTIPALTHAVPVTGRSTPKEDYSDTEGWSTKALTSHCQDWRTAW